jgi:hypothetical protein
VSGQFIKKISVFAAPVLSNQRHYLVDPDYTIDTKPIYGVAANLQIPVVIKDLFSLEANAGYLKAVSKTDFESIRINYFEDYISIRNGTEKKTAMSFITFAAILKLNLPFNDIRPYISFSPGIRYLLEYKTESNYKVTIDNNTIPSLDTGIGIAKRFNNIEVLLELNKSFELVKMAKFNGVELRNNVQALKLGMSWYLPKN